MSGIARRVVFGYDSSNILEFPVEISWDLGWDRDSKLEYIERVKRKVYEQYGVEDALDVTTANSSFENGKLLSPHILRYPGMNMDIVSTMRNGQKNLPSDDVSIITYVYCYMYAICHNEDVFNVFKQYEYFFDVFWKPEDGWNTQARLCVMLKIIIHNKLHHRFFKNDDAESIIAFRDWFNKNKMLYI